MQLTPEECRAAREKLGLTQAELAEKMGGLHKDTPRAWESGKAPCRGAYAVLLKRLAEDAE